jgi:hypothetical protein
VNRDVPVIRGRNAYLDASADGFHDLRDEGLGLLEALAAGEEVAVVVAPELADHEQRPRHQALPAPRGRGSGVAQRPPEPAEPPDLHAQGAPERRHAGRVVPEEEPHVQRRAADDGEVRAVAEVLRLPREERRHERKLQRLRCARANARANNNGAGGDQPLRWTCTRRDCSRFYDACAYR